MVAAAVRHPSMDPLLFMALFVAAVRAAPLLSVRLAAQVAGQFLVAAAAEAEEATLVEQTEARVPVGAR
jgi:hypothetical protein